MKKFMKAGLSAVLTFGLIACGSNQAQQPAATDAPAADVPNAEYVVYNSVGEKVTEIYVYEAGTTEKGTNYAEAGLNPGENLKITISPEGVDTENIHYTFEFTTESGYTGSFDRLAFEQAPINLLAPDALTGATPFEFAEPKVPDAEYKVYNSVGETVTEIYVYETGTTDKGTNYAADGLHNNKSLTITIPAEGVDTENIHYTFEFTTESGYTGSFDRLSFEQAPINLLAQDALTGATPFEFAAPKVADAEYVVYNSVGEKVTEIYVYEAGTTDKGTNYAEAGLNPGENLTITISPEGVDYENIHYTFEFTTESGYTGSFDRLSFEQAPINLLAPDALTGATPFEFAAPAN